MDQSVSPTVLDAIAEAFAQALVSRMQDKLQAPKDAYTFDEVAERYNVSKATVRRWAASGEFGQLLNLSEKTHRITADGLRQFEEARLGPIGRWPIPEQRSRKRKRPDPGPI